VIREVIGRFYYRATATARRYASAVYAMTLCLSVCPSVTSRYCIKRAKHTITQTTPNNI